MIVQFDGAWKATPSFFPLLLQQLGSSSPAGRALVVGAADGKFVRPLAQLGFSVTAIEVDPRYVEGTHPELPESAGLKSLAATSQWPGHVHVVLCDFMDFEDPTGFDVVFTSCPFHYSRNRRHGMDTMVKRLVTFCSDDAFIAFDYMMQIEDITPAIDSFPKSRSEVEGYLSDAPGVEVSLSLETSPFLEAPHVDNQRDHMHRMGFVLARRHRKART